MAVINVGLTKRKNSNNYQMRWVDPDTGRETWKSTKTNIKREAERIKNQTEKELNEGTFYKVVKTSWQDFRERYETEVVPGMAKNTAKIISVSFNHVEQTINPKTLKQINGNSLSKFVKQLREKELKDISIKDYLAHLKSSLNWTKSVGLINVVPVFPNLKRARSEKAMKGRPITLEEFERMLDAVPKVIKMVRSTKEDKAKVVESWKFYLRGLWYSGLRLAESLELYWDQEDKLSVDFSGKYPMLRIRAESEKGNKDRLLPIVPEFAEFLQEVPKDQRTGPVFNPLSGWGSRNQMTPMTISKKVAKIGKKANVAVSDDKFASAHDLRRSFGERWAQLIMPQQLMQLMRHESMETTLRFYVGRNAEKAAEAIYEAFEARPCSSLRSISKNDAKPEKEKSHNTL
ncbi:site-specific integrase [uncultured Gimesia sp.]|uniref:tyrosine-type recombinase/integrase n=1 Tax=uncultured Gimesia sp. TaxID=1678688 RepID=UPI00262090D2|nr:site-specific integrase [uncultured Gimesia sp.]